MGLGILFALSSSKTRLDSNPFRSFAEGDKSHDRERFDSFLLLHLLLPDP